MPTTILICGSPADGFQIVGLFADGGDAESYAEDHSLRDWWIAELTSPEAPAATVSSIARSLITDLEKFDLTTAARSPDRELPGPFHQPTTSITSISAPRAWPPRRTA